MSNPSKRRSTGVERLMEGEVGAGKPGSDSDNVVVRNNRRLG